MVFVARVSERNLRRDIWDTTFLKVFETREDAEEYTLVHLINSDLTLCTQFPECGYSPDIFLNRESQDKFMMEFLDTHVQRFPYECFRKECRSFEFLKTLGDDGGYQVLWDVSITELPVIPSSASQNIKG